MPQVIRASVLHAYFDFCQQQGLNPQQILRSAGLPDDIDPFSDRYLPLDEVYNLLAELMQASNCEHVALLLANDQGLNTLGALGQVMATSNTLGEAWQALMRYGPLYSSHFLLTLAPSPPYLQMDFKLLFTLQHSVREAIEHSVAHIYRVFRQITGQRWQPQAVCFRHAAPQELKPYKKFFRAPLHFDAEFDGMWIEAKNLDLPLPGANPHLHATLCQYAETQIGGKGEDRTLQLVRAHIKHSLPTGQHQMPLVANALGMSPRSLHRKLQQQGYRYEELVAEVRLELSCFYLESGDLPVTRIAENVGYKNVSTFSTAFKKQTHLTPRQWRQQHS
jgi:AraC-like DNA-binding protein